MNCEINVTACIIVAQHLTFMIYVAGCEKTFFLPYVNNKGADQPTYPRSLIRAFVIRCLDSIIHLYKKNSSL